MPAAAFSVILISSFTRRWGPSLRRKLRKSPPAPRIAELVGGCPGTLWRACTHVHRLPRQSGGCRMGVLTLHKLHDDVNGLLLGADTNEPDDVRVVVLLEDPVGTRMGTVSLRGPGCPTHRPCPCHPQDWPGDTALSTRMLQSQ